MPPNPKQGGWQVTSQQEMVGLDPTGKPVEGIKIYFTTSAGHAGSVFVPKDRYNVDNALGAVKAAAALMDQVGSLSG